MENQQGRIVTTGVVLNGSEARLAARILDGISEIGLVRPHRVVGFLRKTRVWSLETSACYDTTENWYTNIVVHVTERRNQRAVVVSVLDGYPEHVEDELVAGAIARLSANDRSDL